MKLLCIDYGLKHLGFATAETPLASPHSAINVNSLEAAVAASLRVADLIHPDRIIVGIPEGELAPLVRQFVQAMQPALTVDIFTHPETLSSQEAIAKLRLAGASRAKLKSDHAYAACLILEDYLEEHPDLVKI